MGEDTAATDTSTDEAVLAEAAASDSALPEIEWQMATSWPLALDTIFGGAVILQSASQP